MPDPIWTESVERSLDLAAELDVVICPEIHSPTPIRHPVVDDYIALIERTGTKHFGLLIDTGIFQDRPIPLRPGETRETRPAFLDGIGVDPADLLDIGKYVVFVQAKFHDIDDQLEDQQIPWEPVLRALRDAGYTRLPVERVRGRAHTVALDRAGAPAALTHAPGSPSDLGLRSRSCPTDSSSPTACGRIRRASRSAWTCRGTAACGCRRSRRSR